MALPVLLLLAYGCCLVLFAFVLTSFPSSFGLIESCVREIEWGDLVSVLAGDSDVAWRRALGATEERDDVSDDGSRAPLPIRMIWEMAKAAAERTMAPVRMFVYEDYKDMYIHKALVIQQIKRDRVRHDYLEFNMVYVTWKKELQKDPNEREKERYRQTDIPMSSSLGMP